MTEEKRFIGFLCPECGKSVIVERTRFQLAASDTKIPCPCGKSELTIRQLGDRCEITVPCALCARDHTAACSNQALLDKPLTTLTCSSSGLPCCHIGGEEDAVFTAMDKLEQAVDKLVMDAGAGRRGAFLDEIVMEEVLGELRQIAARGGISCQCGSKDYGVKVGFSSVELVCARCGAALRLPAATPDDIDSICSKYTLTIPGKKEAENNRVL